MTCLVLAVPAPGIAQAPPCEDCIRLGIEVELSTADGPIVPSLLQSVVRVGGGHFLVSHLFTHIQVAVYDSTGEFVRFLGREGQGPGEFESFPSLAPAWNGGVYAFERYRVHHYDADLRHTVTSRIERNMSSRALGLPGGRTVVDQTVPLADGTTATVSLLDRTGAVESVLEAEDDPIGRTVLGPALDGGFWSIRPNDLEVRKYDRTAEFERSIRLHRSVVEPYRERIAGEGREARPRPRHSEIVHLGGGDLLVLAWVADENWEPRPVQGMFRPSMEDMNLVYSTVIQWVDASSGEVLGARLVPEAIRPVAGAPGLLYSVHETELGHAVTRIWRASVSPP